MTFPDFPAADLDYANETLCEPTLITKCLPSLAVLRQDGVTHLTIVVQVLNGCCVSTWMPTQNFCDDITGTKKHRNAIRAAFSDVLRVITDSVDAYIQADEEAGGDMPSGCYVYVAVGPCDNVPGWRIDASVLSTVADDYPNLAIRLS